MLTNAMGQVLVLCEGKQYWLKPEIAQSDDSLRSLFRLMDANFAAATIKRSEGAAIEIVPREGKKGATPLEHLIAAPVEVNPAILALWKIQQQELFLGTERVDLQERISTIEHGIEAGQAWINATERTLNRLHQSSPDVFDLGVGL
jgi:hypothetical protein